MSRSTILLIIALGLGVLGAEAAEKVKASQPGVVLTLEKKSRSRTQYYVVNTPVGVEEPYFEAEIDSAGLVYTVEYEPKSSNEVVPDGCLAGQAVKVRVDHRHLFVQCLDSDAEMRWEIQKKNPRLLIRKLRRSAEIRIPWPAPPSTTRPISLIAKPPGWSSTAAFCRKPRTRAILSWNALSFLPLQPITLTSSSKSAWRG